jgi:hypothetical protein
VVAEATWSLIASGNATDGFNLATRLHQHWREAARALDEDTLARDDVRQRASEESSSVPAPVPPDRTVGRKDSQQVLIEA